MSIVEDQKKHIDELEITNENLRKQCIELGKLINERHKAYLKLLFISFGREDIGIL